MKAIFAAFIWVMIYALNGSAQVPRASTGSGAIGGTVKGFDGSSITSGVVTASRVPDSVVQSRHARTMAAVSLGGDGTFQFPPLVNGTYQICTQIPGGWISPCEWGGGSGTRVSLSTGRPSANSNVVLKKGVLVNVRVDDPSQLLSTAKSGASLLIGVRTDSFVFRRSAPVAQDVGSRTYQVLMPFDRSVNIVAASSAFQVSDTIGRPLLNSGNALQVLVPSGQQPPTVSLKVTAISVP